MLPGSIDLCLASGSSKETLYEITKSLRFKTAASSYLAKNFSPVPGDPTQWTFSAWVKRTSLGVWSPIFSAGTTGTYYVQSFFGFNTSDQLTYYQFSNQTGYTVNLSSSPQVFKDTSSWYHVVINYSSSLIRAWVNNQLVIQSVSPSATYRLINTAVTHSLMAYGDNSNTYTSDGYLAEVYFADGLSLTPTDFGEVSSLSGSWVPKQYANYNSLGTKGFYLQFKDASSSSSIAYDTSTNANHWTNLGITVTAGVDFDQMNDTPTDNYAVLNQLASHTSVGTFAAGNLRWSYSGGAYYPIILGSIPITNSPIYWEVKVTAVGGAAYIGITSINTQIKGSEATNNALASVTTYSYDNTGKKNNFNNPGSGSAYGASYTTGDTIGIALDPSTLQLTFYKNGVSQGLAYTIMNTTTHNTWYPFVTGISGVTFDVNFGQRSFSYPLTGFKTLSTSKLSLPTLIKPNRYFTATARTATFPSSAQAVSSLNFSPNLVWIKQRGQTRDHALFDTTRGVTKKLASNLTTTEVTNVQSLTSFDTFGYSLGTDTDVQDGKAGAYIDWAWKKDSTAGFDIVSYTGNGLILSPSHSLNAIPRFMIVKARDYTDNWYVYHASAGATKVTFLNTTDATTSGVSAWNAATPSSSTFTVIGGTNYSGTNYIAYLWANIAGFSKIDYYIGTGNSDGPFVWCGFMPRFLIIRNLSNAAHWIILDTVRDTYNTVSTELLTNSSVQENGLAITSNIDIVSNGFKVRSADANLNQSGDIIGFVAFAETPFNYARAR